MLGRGTHLDEVAVAPARELGIADRVVFAGYHRRDYAAILRAMDLLCFLVPGSDGSCRAVLEAAGSGLDRVVKATVYLVDMGDFEEVNGVYAEFFGDHRPARAIVPTKELHHGFLVEIEAIAIVPRD